MKSNSQTATYFDTSVILAMLFSEDSASQVLRIWEESPVRVSSLLTSLECTNVAQRFANKLPAATRLLWQEEADRWLKRTLAAISLHAISVTLLDRIRAEPQLGKCRTLDAIHLGTVLLYRDADIALRLVTSDKRMISAAKELGVTVVEIC
jgi:uncharacterized protein with PIN domain